MLVETQAMIPETTSRLTEAVEDLRTVLVSFDLLLRDETNLSRWMDIFSNM